MGKYRSANMQDCEFDSITLERASLVEAILELEQLNLNSLGIGIIDHSDKKLTINRIVMEVNASGFQVVGTKSSYTWAQCLIVSWRSFYSLWPHLLNEQATILSYSKAEGLLYANNNYIKCRAVDQIPRLDFNYEKEIRELSCAVHVKNVSVKSEVIAPKALQLLSYIRHLDEENLKEPPKSIVEIALKYERDRKLTGLIKTLRGYQCQICGISFKTKSGEDYCECHHLEHLASGGLDISRNILVLCANHHRQFHYGNVDIVKHTNDILIGSIDGIEFSCNLSLRG